MEADDNANDEDEDEDELHPEDFLPTGFNPKRRKSGISAEAPDMEALRAFTPSFFQKDAETTTKLMEAVSGLVYFEQASKEDLEKVVGAMFQKTLAVGETVIRQGVDGDNFYVVGQGLFDCYVDGTHVAEFDGKGAFGELVSELSPPFSCCQHHILQRETHSPDEPCALLCRCCFNRADCFIIDCFASISRL
jgi:cAMP-dependent protein kinase regulator